MVSPWDGSGGRGNVIAIRLVRIVAGLLLLALATWLYRPGEKSTSNAPPAGNPAVQRDSAAPTDAAEAEANDAVAASAGEAPGGSGDASEELGEPVAQQDSPGKRPSAPAKPQDKGSAEGAKSNALLMKNLKLKDERGKVVFEGDIDLGPTLKRIKAGEKFPHRNDGAVFGNRERRLPQKPSGYYREYVVPTPGVRGPGPQRLVIGREGEVYYTADHYKTFRRVAIPPDEAPAHN